MYSGRYSSVVVQLYRDGGSGWSHIAGIGVR